LTPRRETLEKASAVDTRLLWSGTAAGGGLFLVSHNISNILNYAFLLAMSQALAPSDFALFAALFGTIYVASSLANTAQISVAAAVAASHPQMSSAVVGVAMRRLFTLTLPFTVGVLLAAWPFAAFLHTQDASSVALAGVAVWLHLLAAVGYGGLQGSGRFTRLGVGLIIAAAGRLVLGLILVWFGLEVKGALLGVVLGLGLSSALVIAPFVGSALRSPGVSLPPLGLVLAALLTSVAIALPTGVDVVLVQHYFPVQEAAAYAAVSVLGKVVIFGPLAITLVFFPLLARLHAEGRATKPFLLLNLLATTGLSTLLAVAVIVAGILMPQVVLRGYTVSVAFLVTYLAAMAIFSLVVTLLYSSLARRRERLVTVMALALAVQLAIVALWHPDTLTVALALLAGYLVLVIVSLWASWTSTETAEDERQPRWLDAVRLHLLR